MIFWSEELLRPLDRGQLQPGPKGASRDCVSPLSPPSGTQPGHRGNRSSTVSPDLVDPAPRSPLRRTRPSRHQTIQAKAHCKNDSATPNSRLSDRTTQSSTQPSTGTVIFDPALPAKTRDYQSSGRACGALKPGGAGIRGQCDTATL